MESIKEHIEHLRREIERYNYFYYVRNESIVSDCDYDKLLNELKELEEKYPAYKTSESPTQLVGSSLKDTKFKKETHKKAMLSLNNTYNIPEIENFMQRIQKEVSNEEKEYVLELKLDGLSISLQYENGVLVKAVTRGDGKIGENVTENVMQIESIPKFLKKDIDIEVRGEIILPLSNFKKLNEERQKKGEELFANPRNAASGTLRQLDSNIVKERGLDAHFYFIVDAEKFGIEKHSDSIKLLEELGFKTTGVSEIIKDISKMEERLKFWENHRNNLDYETDGMVIKLNDINLWEKLGYTTKSPRWAIAYKYPAKQVTTQLLGVTWQVGRTGKVTPVAELEEVELSGSKVKRASLHNYEEIERKDIRVGDKVFVEKAAEIIPQVVMAIKEIRTGKEIKIEEPKYCPVCGTDLVKEHGLIDIKCPNVRCSAKIKGEIEYFVSRDGMNITGLGNKLVERFLELGYIKGVADLYYLEKYREELEKLEKLGQKSINNLLDSIEKSKKREYSKVLYSLGIPSVGKAMAVTLAKLSKNIDILMNMSQEDLEVVNGIGEKVAAGIYNFFKEEKNIELIEELKKIGLKFSEEEVEIAEKEINKKILSGKTFLVTGTLEKFKRKEIEDKIESLGGQNLSSVSKKLNYLIVGKDAGSKLEKAKKIESIIILTEEEFLALIK
jgi:DNA ligase (NAD+)